jgi:peptidoglycan LD-endopeptidase LytH
VRPRPAVTASLLAALAVALLPAGSAAQSLEEVREERADLQRRLDAAAGRLGEVEDRVARAEAEAAELEAEAEALTSEVGELQEGMQDQVVALFKRGSVHDPVTVFLTSDDPAEALLRAEAIERTVLGDLGEVESLAADQRRLAVVTERAAERRAELADAVSEQEALAADLARDLERAEQLEQRLEEERQRREAEERERRERERRERERARQAEERRAAERDQAPSADEGTDDGDDDPSDGGSSDGGSSDGGSSDGGSSDGGSSDDGSPGAGDDGASTAAGSSGMACPVGQPHSFTDTWGAPRSGGRAHRGTDILAPMGTSVHAIVDGTWSIQSPGPSAGLWAILQGDDGNDYWYLHLQSHTVGDGARVRAGQQTATNGDTGNARGTPHVHFELHPGGGSAINPYPTLRGAC